MEPTTLTMTITDITTFLGTQATALGAGLIDVLEIVVPIALAVFVFYWGFRKIKGATR